MPDMLVKLYRLPKLGRVLKELGALGIEIRPANPTTIQHNVYHAGQISLLTGQMTLVEEVSP